MHLVPRHEMKVSTGGTYVTTSIGSVTDVNQVTKLWGIDFWSMN
jgi:hypothetical protein